jgi:ParB family transcriptional regulator, chromosome partitioning protein
MTKAVKKQVSQRIGSLVNIHSIKTSENLQPRRYFAPEKMKQLIASVKEHGILEPLIVRPLDDETYELVAGERRLRAAQDLGFDEVPVIIRFFTDQQAVEVALLENLQRDDLNPIDETDGILKLICKSLNFTEADVTSLLNRSANARRRGVSLTKEETQQLEYIDQLFTHIGRLNRESFRTNRLPLLKLPQDVLDVLQKGRLEYTKAKAIAKLSSIDERTKLIEKVIAEDLSLSAIKKQIEEHKGKKTSKSNISLEVSSGYSSPKHYEPIGQVFSPSTAMGQELYHSLLRLSNIESDSWDDKNKQTKLKKILSDLRDLI